MPSFELFARRLGLFTILVVVLGITGCESTTLEEPYPPLRFTNYPAIELDVANIEVENAYVPPAAPPNVDHLFPVTPLEATNQWIKDRLQAVGAVGRARVVIANAATIATSIETNKNFSGYFINEQAERYAANLEVVVEVLDNAGARVGVAWASSKRVQTVPEDASLSDKDLVWYRMTDSLMTAFDKEMERQIRSKLNRWVR
jgi:hypothetical protein